MVRISSLFRSLLNKTNLIIIGAWVDDDMVLCYAINTLKITGTKLTVPVISDFLFIRNFRFFRRQTLEKT